MGRSDEVANGPGPRAARGFGPVHLEYWSPVSRSLRHPIKGSGYYVRPERERGPKRKKTKQPKLHQSKLSVGTVLDAPDTSASRPWLRLRITGLVVAVLFALLGLRLWTLQVLQAPAAARAVAVDQIRAIQVQPARGLIVDRSGIPLVSNQLVEQITLSRVTAQQTPVVIGRLAALLGMTIKQIDAIIADPQYSLYKPVPVMTNAPLPDILYIKEHQSEFPGVSSVQTTQRAYPQQELPGPAQSAYPAAQALGYVGSINGAELQANKSKGYQAGDPFGQSGLEYQYESALRGTPGTQQLEVNPKGQVVGTLKTTAAETGDTLVTNIDLGLQQVADNALATQIMNLRSTIDPTCNNNTGCHPAAVNGAVVVMSPQTGAVYAMSSYPGYDPNVWVGGISQADYTALQASGAQNNYAIQGQYTPGSTFKLNTATAALQTGLWTPDEYFDDTGSYTAPGCQNNSSSCTLQNAPGDGALGELDMSKALTVSDDDFFYNLGAQFYLQSARFGQTPIQDQANQYSLGQLTGIDLPGEVQGRVDSPTERQKLHAMSPTGFPNTSWYVGDNMEMAFGQGATVITPIEQAVAYSTFANGGTRYSPQVAAGIVTPDGKVIDRFAPRATGHVAISPSTYQSLLTGFTGVVQDPKGTAYGTPGLSDFPGGVAGKTGTADSEAGKEPTAWFVGFGPTANPQYVVVCVIDQAGYGATAAAPVVGDIFSYLAAHPVTAPVIPPPTSSTQQSGPAPLPTNPTASTTTTTSPGPSTSTYPSSPTTTDTGSPTTTISQGAATTSTSGP